MSLSLFNERTSDTVASHVELALDRNTRRRGLLGRTWLPPTTALVLSPCWMVHTASMKFAIDVLFVDKQGNVVHVAHSLQPWRVAMSWRAHLVIELAAGVAMKRDISVGDRITLAETGHEQAVSPSTRPLPLQVRPC